MFFVFGDSVFVPDEITMLAECGLNALKITDFGHMKQSLFFIQEVLHCVFLHDKKRLHDYCFKYAQCCMDQITEHLKKGIEKFFQTQVCFTVN